MVDYLVSIVGLQYHSCASAKVLYNHLDINRCVCMHTYVCNKYYTCTQATVNSVKDIFRVPLHLVALGNMHHWPCT